MTEAFLHYLFDKRKLGKNFVTTEGHALQIINFGKLNFNAGPDFQESIIIFDNKTWAGHIEFHIKSSDWINHKHQFDKAYDNVIAHFVWEHDREVYINDFKLPVVELKGLIDEAEADKYEKFVKNKSWIPCENLISKAEISALKSQLIQSAHLRLNRKADEIIERIKTNKGDQLKSFTQLLAKSLGGKVNGDVMLNLIDKFPVDCFAKLNYDPFKMQALLHGNSGLLAVSKLDHQYVLALKKEFNYQQKLFGIVPLEPQEWKWSRMRPPATPTIRIAQLAALLSKYQGKISEFNFEVIELDDFWTTHYNFINDTKIKSYQMGQDMIDLLEINVLIPFNYAIAKLKDDKRELKNQITKLNGIRPEKNSIIKHWENLDLRFESAWETQGALEQKNKLCNEKKCLFCTIGKQLMNQ